jgi:hypothetical protein
MRIVALVLLGGLHLGCTTTTIRLAPDASGSPDSSGSSGAVTTALLDGTWKTTTIPSNLFGVAFSSGTIVAAGGVYTLTFVYVDVGRIDGSGCIIATHQSVTSITLSGTSGTGTVLESQTVATGCSNPGSTFTNAIATISAVQSTQRPPTKTPYDGDWTVTMTGAVGSQSLVIAVDGGSWNAVSPANKNLKVASGSVVDGIATATDNVSDFAAQKQ